MSEGNGVKNGVKNGVNGINSNGHSNGVNKMSTKELKEELLQVCSRRGTAIKALIEKIDYIMKSIENETEEADILEEETA